MASWSNNLRRRSVAMRLLLLTTIVFAVFCGVVPVAFSLGNWLGVLAAGSAAILCWVGASGALLLADFLRKPGQLMAAVLLPMTARMAIPLGIGIGIHLHGGPLANAGLIYYLLVFYPVTLAVETMLSLPPTERPCGDTAAMAKP